MATMLNLVIITMTIMMLAILVIMLSKKIERPHCQTYHEVKSKIMATINMMASMLTLVIITMIIMMLAMLAIMLSKFERSHCQTYP